ncbi:hypothetical protein SAY87_012629 [Trapa incisa]|uniref:Uncharacterized protein n=2 Tax=Trapa TaxID=22665 RepID=A0AAN7R0W4_TRANT|nr:hypothetical protein SAY87_012629 [Trapa incisa]KAK4787879.1 hypothetical protein SAY86_011712 [Trapa natans]
MGIDPVTHKPFSHLMAEIATTLPPPHVAHLAEAALGCFKDEMLHLLAKKRVDFHQLHHPIENPPGGNTSTPYISTCMKDKKEDNNTMEKIKLGLTRTIQEHNSTISLAPPIELWEPAGMPSSGNLILGSSSSFQEPEYHYSPVSFMNKEAGSPCTQNLYGESRLKGRLRNENPDGSEEGTDERINGSNILFNSDCELWDLPSDDLMDPIV